MTARYSLGIDLGTSNCAMALGDLDAAAPEIVPIPQFLAVNELSEKPTLPSALYLPHPEEFGPELVQAAVGGWRRVADRRAVRP